MATVFGSKSNETVAWQPEPTMRGTFNLLSTCILTLILCVWSAIHLNLPGEASGARKKVRRLIWIICGLVIPEYIVMIAWTQHQGAKRLAREGEEAFNGRKIQVRASKPEIANIFQRYQY
jgi:hypothetical protein